MGAARARSHPFVERLIGTIRREYLDRNLFWTTADLETKLLDFQHYYNGHRTHAGLKDACQNRLLTNRYHQYVSIRIGGGGTVEGCTRLLSPHDLINSP